MNNDYLEKSKKEWVRASEFPADKEKEYPDHTIVQQFDIHHNKQVYEYGCGGGSDIMSYLRRGNYVTATDIVPTNLLITKQRIIDAKLPIENVNLVLLENSYPLPFDNDSFDIITSHGVLHHIIDVKPVVKELYRVCKPNGLIYIMLYTDIMWDHFQSNGFHAKFMQQYGVDKFEAFGYCTDAVGVPYARPYTTQEGCELLEEAGFAIEDYTHWLNDFFCTYRGVKASA